MDSILRIGISYDLRSGYRQNVIVTIPINARVKSRANQEFWDSVNDTWIRSSKMELNPKSGSCQKPMITAIMNARVNSCDNQILMTVHMVYGLAPRKGIKI